MSYAGAHCEKPHLTEPVAYVIGTGVDGLSGDPDGIASGDDVFYDPAAAEEERERLAARHRSSFPPVWFRVYELRPIIKESANG